MKTKKKKSQGRGLLLAVLILLFLTAIYILVDVQQKKAEEEKETEQTEKALPVSVTEEELSKVTVEYDGQVMTFVKNKEGEESSWSYEEDPEFPLDETLLSAKMNQLTTVTVKRTLEKPGELSEYGLDAPTLKLTVGKGDGSSYTLLFGEKNASTGDYYLQVEGEETVYTIGSSLPAAFEMTPYDVADSEELPAITADEIKKISVEKDGQINEFVRDEETGLVWTLKASDGTENQTDSTAMSSLQSAAAGLRYNGLADYKGENLEAYGLKEPSASITVVTEEKTLSLEIGDSDGNGNYYVKQKDNPEIHTISETTLQTLLNIEKKEYLNSYLNDVPMTDLASLKVTYQGEIKELTIETEEVPVETEETKEADPEAETEGTTEEISETEQKTETVYHYLVDGEEADEAAFRAFYNKLIMLTAQRRMEKEEAKETGEPELILEFTRKDGTTLKTEYYLGTDGLYTVLSDQALPAKANKLEVQSILEKYEELLNTPKEEETESEISE